LIAEEVDQVFPKIVIRDEQGQIWGLSYDDLAPILLSQVPLQQRRVARSERLSAIADSLETL
jgi:hypothetical protein